MASKPSGAYSKGNVPSGVQRAIKTPLGGSPIVLPASAGAAGAKLVKGIIASAIKKHGNDAMKVGDQVARDVAESIKIPKRSSAGLESKTVRTDPSSNASVSRSGSKTIVTTTSPKSVSITTPIRSAKQQAATDQTLMSNRANAINKAGSSAYNAAKPVITKVAIRAGAKGAVAGAVGAEAVDKTVDKLKKKGK